MVAYIVLSLFWYFLGIGWPFAIAAFVMLFMLVMLLMRSTQWNSQNRL